MSIRASYKIVVLLLGFSLHFLCVLCVSAVEFASNLFTAETQRTQETAEIFRQGHYSATNPLGNFYLEFLTTKTQKVGTDLLSMHNGSAIKFVLVLNC
jgi:ABC-type transport system involved in multi-copper enzyme maturation permease subunit